MNKMLFFIGAVVGFAVAASFYLVYPRLHSQLPPGLAAKISYAVQSVRLADTNETEPEGARSNSKKKQGAPRKPGQPEPYFGDLPSLADVNIRDAQLDVVYKGLRLPWSMEFIDSETILIAEQVGRLQRLHLTNHALTEIEGLPDIPVVSGQLGLFDIALHPRFDTNHRIYFSYSTQEPESGKYATVFSTAVMEGDRLTNVQELLKSTPYAKSKSNFGGAIAFDNEGFLYLATGDKSVRAQSQNNSFLNGKILRLHDDGRVPTDNPFVGQGDFRPEIYATGVRNPQGLVFDREGRYLYATEHGPMGGDEVNVIESGKNYGWPTITYGMNYTAKPIGVGKKAPGLEQPLYYYLPSTAISPIEIYYGDMFPEWQGHLLVGALKGRHVSMIDATDGVVRSEQRILKEAKGRVRDIKVAPDGSVYLLIQNGGRVLRLHRPLEKDDQKLVVVGERSGRDVYRMVCASCHRNETPGVPQRRDVDFWNTRIAEVGMDSLYRNTIDGINAMPARGLCEDCTDVELRRAVDFLVKRARTP